MNVQILSRRFLFIAPVVFGLVTPLPGLAAEAPEFVVTTATVGRDGSNRFITPMNQLLTPAGVFVELPKMRPQALALSPDGKLLNTAT